MNRIDKFNHMQMMLEEIFKEDHRAEIEQQAQYWSEVDNAYEQWKQREIEYDPDESYNFFMRIAKMKTTSKKSKGDKQ